MTAHHTTRATYHHPKACIRSAIDKPPLLQRVSIFDHLGSADLAAMAADLSVRSFERGEAIFHQGDRGDALYIIMQGQVRIYHPSAIGRECSVAIFRAGDFFGELALLDDQPRSASAEAMRPTATLMLLRRTFQQTLQKYPSVAERLLVVLATRMRINTEYVEHLAHSLVYQRVGQLVLLLAQHYGIAMQGGIHIDLDLTQEELASLCGVTRETVNRVLHRLRAQRLLTTEHGQIVVLDALELARALAVT